MTALERIFPIGDWCSHRSVTNFAGQWSSLFFQINLILYDTDKITTWLFEPKRGEAFDWLRGR
jgi:hypothetical protein